MNAAEIGIGAEIIDKSKKVRGKINNRLVSTMASIIATLPAYSSNECDIIIDKHKKISTKMTMGIVANGRFLGGGFKAAPRAKFSDGLLDIIILKNSGSFKMIDKLIELKGTSSYKYEEDILYYQASEVKVLPKESEVTVTIDGEPIGRLPAFFKSYPNALTIKSESSSVRSRYFCWVRERANIVKLKINALLLMRALDYYLIFFDNFRADFFRSSSSF